MSLVVLGVTGCIGAYKACEVLRDLQKRGYRNTIVRTHDELDLRNTENVRQFFAANRPDADVVATALVGGIKANKRSSGRISPGEFTDPEQSDFGRLRFRREEASVSRKFVHLPQASSLSGKRRF